MLNRKQYKLLNALNNSKEIVDKNLHADVNSNFYDWVRESNDIQSYKWITVSKEFHLIKNNLELFYSCPIRIINSKDRYKISLYPNTLTEYKRYSQQRLFNILTIFFIAITAIFSIISALS